MVFLAQQTRPVSGAYYYGAPCTIHERPRRGPRSTYLTRTTELEELDEWMTPVHPLSSCAAVAELTTVSPLLAWAFRPPGLELILLAQTCPHHLRRMCLGCM